MWWYFQREKEYNHECEGTRNLFYNITVSPQVRHYPTPSLASTNHQDRPPALRSHGLAFHWFGRHLLSDSKIACKPPSIITRMVRYRGMTDHHPLRAPRPPLATALLAHAFVTVFPVHLLFTTIHVIIFIHSRPRIVLSRGPRILFGKGSVQPKWSPSWTPRIRIQPELQHPFFDLLLQGSLAFVPTGSVDAIAVGGFVFLPVLVQILNVPVHRLLRPGIGFLVAFLALIAAIDAGVRYWVSGKLAWTALASSLAAIIATT